MANKFQLDTDDVLGFNYQAYVSEIRALALSRPAEYFELRAQVLQKVKSDAVGNLYKTFFNVLSTGTDLKGNNIGKLGTARYSPNILPKKLMILLLVLQVI